MRRFHIELITILLLVILIFMMPSQGAWASEYRLRGSVGAKVYSYQSADRVDHLWLLQTTSFSLYRTKTPWSAHFSGGYTGDNADEFSHSGHTRFTRGFLQYGKIGSPFNTRLGRFFLYRGAAVGVLDGVESQIAINRGMRLAAFAGLWGPYSREFTLESSNEAFSFGGEFGWTMATPPFAKFSRFAVSYASLQRNREIFRQRIGLQTYHKINSNITWSNSLQLRMTAVPLRRFISQMRYHDADWNALLEAGRFNPDVSDASWFAGFDAESYTRIRFAGDRWIVPDKMGIGLDGVALLTETKGMKVGPALRFPWGIIGYRFSMGDQPKSDGPWAQAQLDLPFDLQVYATGALTTYEWEAFEIESEDLASFQAGFRWNPRILAGIGFMGEYQAYQSPQFDYDYRVLGGIQWRFDTAGGVR